MAQNLLAKELLHQLNVEFQTLTHWYISIFSFPTKERANKLRMLLNKLKHSNLRKLAVEIQSMLSTCEDHLKRWFELVLDTFLSKSFKEKKEKPKKTPKHLLPIFFHNFPMY